MPTFSTTKFLKNLGGRLAEFAAVLTSAGPSDANAIPALNAQGVLDKSIINGVDASTGNASAGKTVLLGADGKISPTMINTSNSNSKVMTASETLVAGNWINLHDVAGQARVRKADAATGKECMGYVLEGVAAGGTVTVYFEGENTAVTGMVAGPVYLSSTPGAGQAASPTGAGVISQVVGVATGPNSVNYQSGPVIVQAA